jgi:hypothetical protein
MVATGNVRVMRLRPAIAVSTLAATVIAGVALGGAVQAGSDDERDKNTLLAQAQFQLLLLEVGFEPSDITCTRPPLRDVAGELLCYALIGERVTVAALATMESPGEYSFQPINKVDPADLSVGPPAEPSEPSPPQPPASTEPEAPTSSEPEPPASTEPEPQEAGTTDEAIIASIDSALADADGLRQVLTENHDAISSVERIDYDAPTSTVQVVVTTDRADEGVRDSIAFFVTDVMAFLWMEGEPSRQGDATIQPRLEVTVDGEIYGTPYLVMTEVADYTITQQEWLEIVTGTAQLRPAGKAVVKAKVLQTSKLAGAT